MKCVYCFKESDEITRDHVFPAGWYPDNTSSKIQRPTVPSCRECNGRFSSAEQELLIRMGVCVSPLKIQALGINRRLLRSFGIGNESELTPRELMIRRKNLAKLVAEARPYDPEIEPFPGLGPHLEYPLEIQKSIPVPEKELKLICKKIIRGLEYYVNNHRFIEEPYRLSVYFVKQNADIQDVHNILEKFGTHKEYGPGFTVQRAEAKEAGISSVLYRVTVWDTLTLYGSITTEQT